MLELKQKLRTDVEKILDVKLRSIADKLYSDLRRTRKLKSMKKLLVVQVKICSEQIVIQMSSKE